MAGKTIQSSSVLGLKSTDSDEEYFDASDDEANRGIRFDKLTLGPRKKLLVLDLNGFLLSRVFCGNSQGIPRDPGRGKRFGNFFLYKRPFCEEFLKFCFERFEVGIWSSAVKHNVASALGYVMGGMENKLLFVWDQSNCTDSGFKCRTQGDKTRPLFVKELKLIWNKVKSRGPYNSKNTLLIDNDAYKALLNPPYTGIFPTPYDGSENEADNYLDPNGEFGQLLQGLAEAEDVKSYVKQHPFGQPAITSDHPEWDFYSRVLKSLKDK